VTVSLVPVGPDVPGSVAAILKSHEDAIRELGQPTMPRVLANVALKTDLPPAADWPETAIICDEINSIVVSTLVTGSYAWKRADGSAV